LRDLLLPDCLLVDYSVLSSGGNSHVTGHLMMYSFSS